MAGNRTVIGSLVLASLCILIHGVAVAAGPAGKKAVLVTGASSGIGRTITERLSSEGHSVYAGARSHEGIDDLSAMQNVSGVRLDVTVQADIDAAVELVKQKDCSRLN